MIQYHTTADGTWEYEVFGEAPRQLYLFPGLGGTIKKWNREFIQALSQDFQVITFNYPGVGESKSTFTVTSFDDYSRFFEALLKHLNHGQEFHLLGYSMGGYVIRNSLLCVPALKPKTVILCSTSFGGPFRIPPPPEVMEQLSKPGNNLSILMGPESTMTEEDYMSSFIHPTTEQSTPELLHNQTALIQKFFHEHCADIPQHRIGVDALVVHGSHDKISCPKNAELLQSFCDKRSQLFFTQGGHAHTFEFPAEIASAIKAFCL